MGHGIFLPRRWKRQPPRPVPIDVNHPLGAKVQYAYTPWLGLEAITQGQRKIPITAGSGVRQIATQSGVAAQIRNTGNYNGSGLYTTANPALFGSPTRSTVFLLIDQMSYPGTDPVGLLRFFGSDRLQISAQADGRKPQLFLFSGVRTEGNTSINEGFSGSVAFTARGAQSFRLYVNGQLGSAGTTGGFNIRDFRGVGSVTIRWPTFGCPLFLHADELNDDEMARLHENPWQIFRTDKPIIYSFPSGQIVIPTLSFAGAVDISSFAARPKVTLTY